MIAINTTLYIILLIFITMKRKFMCIVQLGGLALLTNYNFVVSPILPMSALVCVVEGGCDHVIPCTICH